VEAPSLPSTAETWWSIVLAEMNSFAPISALVYPAERVLARGGARRPGSSGCPAGAAHHG
jgi:hypothetical protein